MTSRIVRRVVTLLLCAIAIGANSALAGQPPQVTSDGRVIPGESCGFGVTTRNERIAILGRWIVTPAVFSLVSLGAAVTIRRRMRRIVSSRRRTLCAKLVGVFGAVWILLCLHVVLVGGLHFFDVISLYEPFP